MTKAISDAGMNTRFAIHSMSSPSVASRAGSPGHRGPKAEELHHQHAADPDDGHRDVHEEQEARTTSCDAPV